MNALLLAASLAAGAPAPAPKALLASTIQANATCPLGQAPQVRVTIHNRTHGDVYLVGSLDASDCKWRYPHAYFEVIGPDGKSAVQGIGRCGLMNPLREKDFVKVPPRGRFDPYRRVDDFGFFGAHQLRAETFAVPGTYRIRFVYSTAEADIRKWVSHGRDPRLVWLFARVPRTTVTSNEIVVEVLGPKK
jgi:hypothetical protein